MNLKSLNLAQEPLIKEWGPAYLSSIHKVCEIGGDELHRPPVVALRFDLTFKTQGAYRYLGPGL